MDPRYAPSQWLVFPYVTVWPKTKRHMIIWLIGHYVHYVVQNGRSVILHNYMDFLRCARKKAEEMRRMEHIFGAYLEKCTWEGRSSLRYAVLLAPSKGKAWYVQWLRVVNK